MRNIVITMILAAIVCFFFISGAHADIPTMLNYQGYIEVDGAAFTGTGLFKFAIVDAAGTNTYWSNDGTSTTGNEPSAYVTVSISSGIYSVKLGDTSIMGEAIPASVFANKDTYLRVWFDDGTHGFQRLDPDSQITSAAYAYKSPDRAATFIVDADGNADYTSIQGAIDALPSSGGCVLIREGEYEISSSITIPSNASLIGCGMNTKIILVNNSDIDVIKNKDSGGNDDIVISNLQIDGNKSNNTGTNGIYFQDVTKSRIENCWIHDCDKRAIYLNGSSNNIIIGNFCDDSGTDDGITISNASDNNVISSNNCGGNDDYGINVVDATCTKNIIDGNILLNNTQGSYNDGAPGSTVIGDNAT